MARLREVQQEAGRKGARIMTRPDCPECGQHWKFGVNGHRLECSKGRAPMSTPSTEERPMADSTEAIMTLRDVVGDLIASMVGDDLGSTAIADAVLAKVSAYLNERLDEIGAKNSQSAFQRAIIRAFLYYDFPARTPAAHE